MNKIDNINSVVLEGRYGSYSLPSGYTGGTGETTSTSTSINTGITLDTNDFTLEAECRESPYGGKDWNIMQSTEANLGNNGQIGFCGRSPYKYYISISNNASTVLNTGIIADVDDMEFELEVTPSTGSWYIFQSRESVGGTIYGISGSLNGNTFVINWAGVSFVATKLNRSDTHRVHIKCTFKNGNGTVYIQDSATGEDETITNTYTFTPATQPICLFGNIVNGIANNTVDANNAIRYARLKKNGVVVMDYEPVTYNNTAGFHDKVSRTFKTATTGSLVANTLDNQRALSASIGSTLLLSNMRRRNDDKYFLYLEYKDNVATFRVIDETTGEIDTVSANVPYSSISSFSAPVYVFGDGNTRVTSTDVTIYHVRIRKSGMLVLDGVIASRTDPSSTGGIYNFANSSFITRSGGSITVGDAIRQGTFYENKYITSVDLSNTPWYNNDMDSAFSDCTNLTTVSGINDAVTNMDSTFRYCTSLTNVATLPTSVTNLSGTFYNCTSLTDAPTIPSSVTDMSSTFFDCTSLTNVPALPSSVVNMHNTFYGCSSLVNAPVIPSGVTDMCGTFYGCIKLTGNVIINSSIVNDVSTCFYNTTLAKYVYIPYNSTTYNTFTAAGYDEVGTKEGVYLRDLSSYQG